MSRFDRFCIRIRRRCDAARERGEFHRLQECDELRAVLRIEPEVLGRNVERRVFLQRHELTRKARQIGIGDDGLAPLLLFDLAGPRKQRVQIAILFEELGCRLRPYPGDARHVVGRIAGHGLEIDHLFRRHAPLFDHVRNGDLLVLHAVVHRHLRRDELHEVLVGGNDGHVGARLLGKPCIGRDEVVGLVAFLLDAGQVEGAGGVADEPELRDQILRRRCPVGLVLIVEPVAEGLRGIVEDHGQMCRRHAHGGVARVGQKLPEHVAESRDRIDGKSVRLAVERRDGVERPEDEARAVDEEEMITVFHAAMDSARQGKGPLRFSRTTLLSRAAKALPEP